MAREAKKVITESYTLQDAETFLTEYAESDAREKKILAEMDLKIVQIREKYQNVLTAVCDQKEKAFEKLMHFSTANTDLFAKKKSINFTQGTIGFRTTTPSLKTLKGFTWPSVANLVKEFQPQYMRIKEEVDKEKLLSDRDQEDIITLLPKLGLKVEQNETFYVEPKKEEV